MPSVDGENLDGAGCTFTAQSLRSVSWVSRSRRRPLLAEFDRPEACGAVVDAFVWASPKGGLVTSRGTGCRKRSRAARVSALRASILLAPERCAHDWPIHGLTWSVCRSVLRSHLSRPGSAPPAQPLHRPSGRQTRGSDGPRLRRRRRHCVALGPAPLAPSTNKPVAPPFCCRAPGAARDRWGATVCQLIRARCVASASATAGAIPTTHYLPATKDFWRRAARPAAPCGLKQDRHERLDPNNGAIEWVRG